MKKLNVMIAGGDATEADLDLETESISPLLSSHNVVDSALGGYGRIWKAVAVICGWQRVVRSM